MKRKERPDPRNRKVRRAYPFTYTFNSAKPGKPFFQYSFEKAGEITSLEVRAAPVDEASLLIESEKQKFSFDLILGKVVVSLIPVAPGEVFNFSVTGEVRNVYINFTYAEGE